MKKYLALSLVLVGCGTYMSPDSGYNIAGVGLVPDKKICYDTTRIIGRDSVSLKIEEKECSSGYKWDM